MSCGTNTLKGMSFSCKDNAGGIKQVWLAIWEDGLFTSSSGVLSFATATNKNKFKNYKFRTGNGSMNTTVNVDESNGTLYSQTELNMKFTKLNPDDRSEIVTLMQENLVAIVEDNTGNAWVLGYKNPVTLSAGSVQTGASMADFAGYDITLTDYLPMEIPYSISATDLTALQTITSAGAGE